MDGLSGGYFSGNNIFGDLRLDRRLEITFELMAKRPGGTLPKKLPNHTALFGGYRMFNNKGSPREPLIVVLSSSEQVQGPEPKMAEIAHAACPP